MRYLKLLLMCILLTVPAWGKYERENVLRYEMECGQPKFINFRYDYYGDERGDCANFASQNLRYGGPYTGNTTVPYDSHAVFTASVTTIAGTLLSACASFMIFPPYITCIVASERMLQ